MHPEEAPSGVRVIPFRSGLDCRPSLENRDRSSDVREDPGEKMDADVDVMLDCRDPTDEVVVAVVVLVNGLGRLVLPIRIRGTRV